MVRISKYLKSDKNGKNKQQKITVKNKFDKIPIYPARVQNTAFPEKAYILGIEKLSIAIIILFALSSILGIGIFYKLKLGYPNPQIIYYSDENLQFARKSFDNDLSKKGSFESIYEVLAEQFLFDFIRRYYSISNDNQMNFSNWCNCITSDNPDDVDNQKLSKCYICKVSDPEIYERFGKMIPKLQAKYENNVERKVQILKNTRLYYGISDPNRVRKGFFQNLAIGVLQSFSAMVSEESYDEKVKPYMQFLFYYKTDFVVSDYKAGKLINREVLSSYNSIGFNLLYPLIANRNWVNNFKMLEHSSIFHNQADYMLKRYFDESKDFQEDYKNYNAFSENVLYQIGGYKSANESIINNLNKLIQKNTNKNIKPDKVIPSVNVSPIKKPVDDNANKQQNVKQTKKLSTPKTRKIKSEQKSVPKKQSNNVKETKPIVIPLDRPLSRTEKRIMIQNNQPIPTARQIQQMKLQQQRQEQQKKLQEQQLIQQQLMQQQQMNNNVNNVNVQTAPVHPVMNTPSQMQQFNNYPNQNNQYNQQMMQQAPAQIPNQVYQNPVQNNQLQQPIYNQGVLNNGR